MGSKTKGNTRLIVGDLIALPASTVLQLTVALTEPVSRALPQLALAIPATLGTAVKIRLRILAPLGLVPTGALAKFKTRLQHACVLSLTLELIATCFPRPLAWMASRTKMNPEWTVAVPVQLVIPFSGRLVLGLLVTDPVEEECELEAKPARIQLATCELARTVPPSTPPLPKRLATLTLAQPTRGLLVLGGLAPRPVAVETKLDPWTVGRLWDLQSSPLPACARTT